jgi:hypothetical protein
MRIVWCGSSGGYDSCVWQDCVLLFGEWGLVVLWSEEMCDQWEGQGTHRSHFTFTTEIYYISVTFTKISYFIHGLRRS